MRVGALIRACAHAMERFGIKREEHPIHPHITLGRVRSQRNYTLLKKEIEEGMKTRPSETTAFTVDTLTLYQSDLTPQGPRYTSLYSAIFAMT
jgi:2'-5' RNA ligase